MWQSSGKYVPRVEQLVKVAPAIIEMGCFSRVETNGGGFEQINLLFGQNPNQSVRRWTTPFNEAGIQTQMLERGLNGIRMSPVPKDVRELMFKVKKKQGTDIARSFDGLNDPTNLRLSIEYAKAGGMISQAALSLTFSKVHTVEYYVNLAFDLIEKGADEVCIKDMAGIGRPVSVGKIIKKIKDKYPNILVQYHGHSGPGFSVASSLEAARAGADIIDVGMEPLSWGTGHADLLTIHAMLEDAGFEVPDINLDAYMEVRRLTQEFIDDFLGLYINPKNRFMNSLLIGPGLPGGMMGSLMADLEKNLKSLNSWMQKRDKPTLTQDELLIKLFKEVEYIWPIMGYPPLVTPFSQYVKNMGLMNVTQMLKGRDRWSIIDDNTWGMLLGRSGKLPGKLGEELKLIANAQNRKFYEGDPQDLYPDQLHIFKKELKDNNWDEGEDQEELMELAMHPQQYRAFKNGKASEDFERDLKAKRDAQTVQTTQRLNGVNDPSPQSMRIKVNEEEFLVSISYDNDHEVNGVEKGEKMDSRSEGYSLNNLSSKGLKEILAPLEGKFYLTKEVGQKPIQLGDNIKEGDVVGYIESMKVINAVSAELAGEVVEICFQNDESVEEDEVLIRLR